MSAVHALIIEDNRDSMDVLARLLTKEGATCTKVSQPTQLKQSDLEAVQVVFLDLDMPDMSGYEVFDLLRNLYQVQVPIIAYTVNTNEKATTHSVGFNGMIAKPLDADCFHTQFLRILAGEAIWDDC